MRSLSMSRQSTSCPSSASPVLVTSPTYPTPKVTKRMVSAKLARAFRARATATDAWRRLFLERLEEHGRIRACKPNRPDAESESNRESNADPDADSESEFGIGVRVRNRSRSSDS